jgi:hypothetical protein
MKTWSRMNSAYCAWSHERPSYHNTDDELAHVYHVVQFALVALWLHYHHTRPSNEKPS